MPLPKNRKEHIEGFLAQIRPEKLKPGAAATAASIARYFQTWGDVSDGQYETLRKFSLASTSNRRALSNRWERYYQAYRG